nr:type II toxin-antitoxin system VapC family toxin [Candidatus Sigynarchaeum springense]MDO8117345.1 type II toxin-antitoxin system VapC family toxin [Candidatus Sigynarchaeota archaeon]
MTLLFDASAIYNVILRFEEKCYAKFRGNFSISLVFYELGNVPWKHLARGSISQEDALDILAIVEKLPSVLTVLPLDANDIKDIFSIAASNSITFYDASYVYYAKKQGLDLVTDDQKVEKAARKLVGVHTSRSLP